MSKGLEALERIINHLEYIEEDYKKYAGIDLDTIEKELKALEVIKEHTLYCENVDCFVFVNVTKEVNELLKEVLL